MEKTKIQSQLRPVYDYVIVGGGACGCVLASRLSEDSSKSVLLLEAGGDDREIPNIPVPGDAPSLQLVDHDWQYKSIPQENAFKGFENRIYSMPRGKVLGGSGSINYMMFMRGTPHDYDIWKNMGCPGWGYEDVLPYFIKSESCLDSELQTPGVRGTDGPTLVSQARMSPFAKVFVEAGKSLGYPETDCNGKQPIGFMVTQSNIGDGVRQGPAECYLRPASNRENLHIATHCLVTKVLIEQKIARGVEYVRGFAQRRETVRARREVILCGGAINTPQILMLSGIGPAQHLQEIGIEVISDLPVGDNLQDHLGVLGLEFSLEDPITIPLVGFNSREAKDQYDTIRSGGLATNVIDALCMVRSDAQDPGNPNPDIFAVNYCTLVGSGEQARLKTITGMREEVWDAMFGGNFGKHGVWVHLIATHPKSRGTVRLRNADPFTYPAIDFKTFSNPDDIKTVVSGIKFVLKIFETKPMKKVGASFTARVLPGYTGPPFTDEYWEEYARTMTHMGYHPSCTCRMGPIESKTTVVDPHLRVKGVDRLRVVDASIMPEIPCCNLYAPCIMIAEKAADIIRSRQPCARL